MKKFVLLMVVCITMLSVLSSCGLGSGFKAPRNTNWLFNGKPITADEADAASDECYLYVEGIAQVAKESPLYWRNFTAAKQQCLLRKGYRWPISKYSTSGCNYSANRADLPACQGKDVITPE